MEAVAGEQSTLRIQAAWLGLDWTPGYALIKAAHHLLLHEYPARSPPMGRGGSRFISNKSASATCGGWESPLSGPLSTDLPRQDGRMVDVGGLGA